MDSLLTYQIALSMVEGMNVQMAYRLEECGISPSDFFRMDMSELSDALSGSIRMPNIAREEILFRARAEHQFITNHNIRALYIDDEQYPLLLRETHDAPLLLYVLGKADLNSSPAFNVVGTRRCTAYGLGFTKSFISDMSAYFPDALVVSGLAYGIDACAHTAAIEAGMPTVAVMAHGLDMIYPAAHRDLAKRILAAGGAIVSEYPSKTRPWQRNFLQRNRIVAGMCELTVVAESEVRGGAMSTANQAFSYSREVVALPGRYTDIGNSGCNYLIARHKAQIYTGVADVIKMMGWEIPAIGTKISADSQPGLFPELQGDAAIIYDFLRQKGGAPSIDEIHAATSLPVPKLMSTLCEMEFEGIVSKLPGSRYELA